jgi:potassium-transporting ATPase KdpC subunit
MSEEERDSHMFSLLRPAAALLGIFTVLTGLVYPLAVTGVAQAVFPKQANGSLLRQGDRLVGSELIGQPFDEPRYFWSRPSATAPHPYNAGASSGTNLGPLHPALEDAVRTRVGALHAADPGNRMSVPVDLVTASGSGLDPHISIAAANYQVSRVARARAMPAESVQWLLNRHVEGRTWGLLGEPRVNVLRLNRALDRLAERAR